MLRAMYTSISGLRNHQTMLDTVGNNIANVNTYGFKASTTTFKDLLSQTIQGASAPNAVLGGTNNRQVGLGMQIDSITQRHTQGAIQSTGVLTDLAITGDGFFRVTPDITNIATDTQPTFYQRAGDFKTDAAGDLVTNDGYHVIGYGELAPPGSGVPDTANQTILNIPPATTRSFTIGQDGRVTRIDTTGALVNVGWVSLAKFANPSGLAQAGSNKWQESVNSGIPNNGIAGMTVAFVGPPATSTDMTSTGLISGGLEMSNVDLATEFTEMIKAQRGFQANSRVITTSDEILQELVNLKR